MTHTKGDEIMDIVDDEERELEERELIYLDRLCAYAIHLNRMLQFWEIDAILAVDPDWQ